MHTNKKDRTHINTMTGPQINTFVLYKIELSIQIEKKTRQASMLHDVKQY